MADFNYCQSQIEGNKCCEVQCEHCKEYYAPLEAERNVEEEYKKCVASPYYFYVNYATINGKKATTNRTEEDFNNFFNLTNGTNNNKNN